MSKLSVVVGGAFGSEAKGAVTAKLVRMTAAEGRVPTVVRVAGHNAGHTAYDDEGREWALRTVPVGLVADSSAIGVIAAGSEVDPRVLRAEVEALEAAGIEIRSRLIIDRSATWIEDRHIETEGGLQMHERTGSTAKGVGAARADRAMRTARTVADWSDEDRALGIVMSNTAFLLNAVSESGRGHVIIEGTQGYGLGLHTEHYPLTTSSDCRAIDFLAMAGVNPTLFDYEVWVVMRRYPIRVAGPSGELRGETTWDALGLPEELTTVTKKVRRVGDWDPELAAAAVIANGGPRCVKIALTMADQAIPALAGITDETWSSLPDEVIGELDRLIEKVEDDAGADVHLVGTGPNSMLTWHDAWVPA